MRPFRFPVRIYYEDTDSGGVVYYANYLKYMERARTEWLRFLGFEQDQMIEDEGVIFAVRSVTVDYNSPARFNDELEVVTSSQKVGKASISLRQDIYRSGEKRPLCSGAVKIASLNSETFKPVPLPEKLYKKIQKS
ncbi:MAG: tol-pal system-associated acyl-CoA thioesterase [Gammaproteobacteria bacterium]|uniref:Tol-pal system-associated acyl-CoA thioesterase n=1 Tax=Candidatus Thiopontia autotrophica TaxID=2841688 RepID=A0A8J6PAV7_9GAMM|nr:tol-pal system-associated acyl-CoA thioesterase [Candidatus Thiopontia autotrophica]